MSADVYSSLLKALTSPDMGDISCYPVRVSAAGAIAELVEVRDGVRGISWILFSCICVNFLISLSFIIALYLYPGQNEYLPPEWLPVLQVIVGRIGDEDEESSILFQLLSTLVEAGSESVAPHIPHIVSLVVGAISKYMATNPGPWSQVCAITAMDLFIFLIWICFDLFGGIWAVKLLLTKVHNDMSASKYYFGLH